MTDASCSPRADAIAARAYAPYSNFHVGCAVLMPGRAGRGGRQRRERRLSPRRLRRAHRVLACDRARATAPGDFVVAAITASPCGGCRQWLAEMGVERVVFRNGGGSWR